MGQAQIAMKVLALEGSESRILWNRQVGAQSYGSWEKYFRRGGYMEQVPLWKKSNLTLEEAAQYFNIGTHKLREISNAEDCSFVLWVGSKRLIKRALLEKYLETAYSI